MSFIILDLDNCVANDGWRIPAIQWDKENPLDRYHDYHSLAAFDQSGNRELYLNCKHDIIILTARPVLYRAATEEWMRRNGIGYALVMMRDLDDHSPSTTLKRNQLQALFDNTDITPEKIICAYDDRPDVISMYKGMGINAEVRAIHDVCAYTKPTKENQNADSGQSNGANVGDVQGEGKDLQSKLPDDRGSSSDNVSRGDNAEDARGSQQVASVPADNGKGNKTRKHKPKA